MTRKTQTDPLRGAPAAVLDSFNRLNAKQKAFALALPSASSQKEAARLAGYSENTAVSLAFKTANHPDVKVVVGYLTDTAAAVVVAEVKDSVERTIGELCRISLADPRTLFDDEGRLLPIKEWPDDIARAVSSIESFEEYQGRGEEREAVGMVRKVKFHGKIDAIDKLAKIKGFYRPEKHEHTHRVQGMSDVLDEIDGASTGPGAG